MKPIFKLFLFFVLVLSVGCEKKQESPQRLVDVVLEVGQYPLQTGVERLGVNLGSSSCFFNNLLMNPGLEARVQRGAVIVSESDKKSFLDEIGIQYPDHFWDGAKFEVIFGEVVGKNGIIEHFFNSDENGYPQYVPKIPTSLIQSGDVVAITALFDERVDGWKKSFSTLDQTLTRPKSPGNYSVKMSATALKGAVLSQKILCGPFLDSFRLSFWAKAASMGQKLLVRVQGSSAFNQMVQLSDTWQQYELFFDIEKPSDFLHLFIETDPGSNEIWIDDFFLGSSDKSPSVFADWVVEALKQINPSYIKEFPHVGDSFDNWMRAPLQRNSWALQNLGGKTTTFYSYSLPEFLDLCDEVGANPWIVTPATLSMKEANHFADFLLENSHRFGTCMVEFGYENWNFAFRAAQVPYPEKFGALADRIFEQINNHFDFAISGHALSADLSLDFLSRTNHANTLTVPVKILPELEKATPDDELLSQLFESNEAFLKELLTAVEKEQKNLAVYEMNFDTLKGNASVFERTRVVAGAVSGVVLAKKALEILSLGVWPVMIDNLVEPDVKDIRDEQKVPLHGIIAQIKPKLRFRPTGLSMLMLNQVIDGDLYPVSSEKGLTACAFKGKDRWRVAVVSARSEPLKLKIAFPEGQQLMPRQLLVLDFSSPFDTNEQQELVKIEYLPLDVDQRAVYFTLPPFSFLILK